MVAKNHFYHISLAMLLCTAFLAFQVTCCTLQDASMYERHEQWMTRHGKVYKDPREREKRFRIFNENVNYVEAFNNAANKPYKLGINQFETSPIRSSLRQEIDSRGICVPQSLGQPLLSMKM